MFTYEKLPVMEPVRIPTKDQGFFKATWTWLTNTRKWKIKEDFKFTLYNKDFVIPAGFVFDGASIPRMFRTIVSPVGVLLIAGLIHDFGYKYAALLRANKLGTVEQNRRDMDEIFYDVNEEVNGLGFLSSATYLAVRVGGWFAWNSHRKRNAKIKDDFKLQ